MGVGIFLTIALRGIQFRYLWYALKLAFGFTDEKGGKGDLSHFQSLMTALAATMGIGNIAGVATAFVVGGPGALFWMWLTAILGMATKYAEALLALKYRITDKRGEMCGGPMYFIERGLGWKSLALAFAFFGAVASFGGGNILQANSVSAVLHATFSIDPLWSGILLMVVTGLTLLGGVKSIGKTASLLVPMMALFYIAGALVVILANVSEIPRAISDIFYSAFFPQAFIGGALGSSFLIAMQTGISRGLMTSESGLGTASIAAAAARSDHPGRQAMVSMTGSFLATVVMCSVTALVLGVTGVLGLRGEDGAFITGAALTVQAFESVIPMGGGIIVSIGLVLFAFTTLLGWAYYGEKCVEYLVGEKVVPFYRVLFTAIILPGALLNLEVVWTLSDIANGLMAFPNLIALFALSPVVLSETRDFLALLRSEHLTNNS
jgi:AGCS family alanine or glycine:cation symporter